MFLSDRKVSFCFEPTLSEQLFLQAEIGRLDLFTLSELCPSESVRLRFSLVCMNNSRGQQSVRLLFSDVNVVAYSQMRLCVFLSLLQGGDEEMDGKTLSGSRPSDHPADLLLR